MTGQLEYPVANSPREDIMSTSDLDEMSEVTMHGKSQRKTGVA
jgi:hypothetical protein